MPGGTSLDQLDMKFGTLNFMANDNGDVPELSLIHISEPTRRS